MIKKTPFKVIVISVVLAVTAPGCEKLQRLPAQAAYSASNGLKLAQKGDWKEASFSFKFAAYSAPLDPQLLFNEAFACDKTGVKPLQAIAWYTAYLALQPKAANASLVRQRISTLEENVAHDVQKLINNAKEIVHKLPDDKLRFPLEKLISAQVAAGDIKGAKEINRISNVNGCIGLDLIVNGLVQADRIQDALDFMKESGRCYQCMTDDRARLEIILEVARKGDFDKVNEILTEIKGNVPPKTSLFLVEILARAGKIQEAKRMLASVDMENMTKPAGVAAAGPFFSAYYALVEARVKTGDSKTAGETLTEMQDAFDQMISEIVEKRELAMAYRPNEDPCSRKTEYSEEVDDFQTAQTRSSLYGILAKARAIMGDRQGAEKILAARKEDSYIQSVPMYKYRSDEYSDQVYYNLVQSYLVKRDIKAALALAGSIKSENIFREARKDIGEAQVKAGDMKGAGDSMFFLDGDGSRKDQTRNLVGRAKAALRGRLDEAEVFDITVFMWDKDQDFADEVFNRGLSGAIELLKGKPPEEVAEGLADYASGILKFLKEVHQIDAKWQSKKRP